MGRYLLTAYVIFSLVFLLYLIPSSPDFPSPPENSPQSGEPADTETPLRRAYFTNLTREEVMAHYKNEFKGPITLNFNYPPEEAQTIIRDQTRSWYLEELVHPFRDSIYINGFIPQADNEVIVYKGQKYYQKITLRYVPSSLMVRLLSGIGALVSILLVAIILKKFIARLPLVILNFIRLFK